MRAKEKYSKEGYFSHLRHDLLALIDWTPQRVLSVGCGEGRTEAELVQRGAKVFAIELNPSAAASASSRGISVVVGSVDEMLAGFEGDQFDLIILADVLEHLPRAGLVLEDCAKKLVAGGRVVISVPNFRNIEVFLRLAFQGRLPEEPSGVFDMTHVRWTTRRLVADWCDAAGLVVRSYEFRVRKRHRWLPWAKRGVAGEFLGRQCLLIAEKMEPK